MKPQHAGDGLFCPKCKNSNTGCAEPGDQRPQAGHIAVCLYCGSINQFVERAGTLALVVLPQAELDAIVKQHPDFHEQLEKVKRSVRLTRERYQARDN